MLEYLSKFRKQVATANQQTPKLIQKALQNSHLEEINKENLLKGLDSEGNEMPFYSDTEYGYEKTVRNPRNGGRWDLKNTGQFHKGLTVKVSITAVKFSQRFRNRKIDWLNRRLEDRFGDNKAVGISKKNLDQAFEDNIPELNEKIVKILKSV